MNEVLLKSLKDMFSRAYHLTHTMKEFYEREIEKLKLIRHFYNLNFDNFLFFDLLIVYNNSLPHLLVSVLVNCHGAYDDNTDDYFLDVVGNTGHIAPVAKKRHDKCTDHRTENRTFAAAE